MAHYILVTTEGDNQAITHVEAKNRTAATRQFFADAEKAKADVPKEATLYRVAAAPVKVRLRTVTETKVEIE